MTKRKFNYPVTVIEDLSLPEARKIMKALQSHEARAIQGRWIGIAIFIAVVLGGFYGLR